MIVFVLPGLIVHAHDECICTRTSFLVHEARGMAAIKQWFVRFLQHRAANFHRISGAQALERDKLVSTCSKFSSVPIK